MYSKGLIVAAAALLLAATARANSISIQYLGVNPGFNVKMSYDMDGPGPISAATQTLPVGAKNYVPLAGSDNQKPFNKMFKSFCIDIDESPLSSGVFDIKPLELAPVTSGPGAVSPDKPRMSTQQADYIRELWGEQYAGLWTGTSTEQQIKTTAFQLAVWEILFERSSTKNVGGGYLKVVYSGAAPAYVTLANQFLTSTYDAGFSAYERNLVALTNAGGQDHMAVVPLPPAFLAGLALIGSVVVAKARSRRQDVV